MSEELKKEEIINLIYTIPKHYGEIEGKKLIRDYLDEARRELLDELKRFLEVEVKGIKEIESKWGKEYPAIKFIENVLLEELKRLIKECEP